MIDKLKVLEKISGLDLMYANQNHRKIEYFIKNGNPSQYYLELICDMANIDLVDVQKDKPKQLNRSTNPTAGLTPEGYKSLSNGYQGD